MSLYLTKLMFAVYNGNNSATTEFDEQIRIIESGNSESAFYKARVIGRKQEESFLGSNNRSITWKFIDVTEVYALGELKDGEQLYSNTHKIENGDTYIQYIRQKSMEIQVKSLTFV